MKRFVVCFDGTWQKLRQPKPTNIALIARSVAHTNTLPDGSKIPQIVIYTQGVGSNTDALGKAGFMDGITEYLNRMLGGIFGDGLEDNIVETYLRLAFNYEAGDEIYVFGFSRGAFCARSFAGLIGCAGIVSRLHAEQAWEAFRLYRTRPDPNATQIEKDDYAKAVLDFRMKFGKGRRAADGTRIQSDEATRITYLGIFETVGQRGLPSALGGLARTMNRQFGFHDMLIGENVMAARHAVAIDERRLGFPPTLWEGVEEANKRPHCQPHQRNYQQRWFIGTHGDVGGGEGSTLSAAPLKWVAEGAAACGLRFYAKHGEDESPMDAALREAGLCFDGRISHPKFWDSLSPMNYPIYSRRIWSAKASKERPSLDFAADVLDPTVARRAGMKKLRYRPAPLRPFRDVLTKLVGEEVMARPVRARLPAREPWIEGKAMRNLALHLIGLLTLILAQALLFEPSFAQTPSAAEAPASYPATLRMSQALLGGTLMMRITEAVKTTAVPKLQAQLTDSPQLQRLSKQQRDFLSAYVEGLPGVFDAVLHDALPAIEERVARDEAPKLTPEEAGAMAAYFELPGGARLIDAFFAGITAGASEEAIKAQIVSSMSSDDTAAYGAFAYGPGGAALQRESKAIFEDIKLSAQAEFTPRLQKRVREDLCREFGGQFCRAA